MSTFYGTLKGNRGEATRCGSKESGIETYAASWAGAVRVVVVARNLAEAVQLARKALGE